MRVSLCVLLALYSFSALAEAPTMATSVVGMQVTFEQCKTKVSAALSARGYEDTYDFGNGWIGVNERFSVSAGCTRGNNETVLTVVVASNDANPTEERDAVVAAVRGGGGKTITRGRTITWTTTPRSLSLGQGRSTYVCPANGEPGVVWGTDFYTDDSSICTAAVHAGAITMKRGGSVTISMSGGRSSYRGSRRNGVSTIDYGPWNATFTVAGGGTPTTPEDDAVTIGWTETARTWRGQEGARIRVICPPNGSAAATVWGSGTYTDDSAVCVAAVHAGRITFARGGEVTIEMREGESSYDGSTQRGVTTRSYGSWDSAFVFVE